MLPTLSHVSKRLFTRIIAPSSFKTNRILPHKWNTTLTNSLFNHQHHPFTITTINVPNMGDSISEGTLVEWTKNIGDPCQVDDVIAVIETDKVSIDIRTDYAGVITEQLANIDDTLEVNAPLFKIDTDAKSTVTAPSTEQKTEPIPTQPQKTDTKAATTPAPAPPKPSTKPSPPIPPPPAPSTTATMDRSQNRVSMSRMRQRISQRLMEAQQTTASLTTFNEIDMKNIITIRNKYKDKFQEKYNVKLGFMSAFVKASCSALESIPAVNAYIDINNKEIIYNNYCDVSIAVASPNGLVVPVIRNANKLNFYEIENEIIQYSQKAKNNTLSLEEMSGGTFTISNGGVFGSLFGTPILNPPQSAILGMHGTFEKPVVIDKQIEIRPVMMVALTYDHRIIDGREAVLFLKRIKECVEDPVRMLLDV